MSETVLKPLPISAERFAPYGELIQAVPAAKAPMNDARFERYHDLANIDVRDKGGRTAVSIARCKFATSFPYRFDTVERHPRGSQAFIPLSPFPFIVVVGPAAETVEAADLRAFVTNGRQGINYHKGVWHMPLIALQAGQEFLVIDRLPATDNFAEVILNQPLVLEAP